MMRDAKHVSVVPTVSPANVRHHHQHGRHSEKVPVFVEKKKNQKVPVFVEKKKGFQRKKNKLSLAHNFVEPKPSETSEKEVLFPEEKLQPKLTSRRKGRKPSKISSYTKPRERESKSSLLAAAKSTKRRRRKKQVPVQELTAGDLWSLNRSAKNFQELRERGRRGRQAKKFHVSFKLKTRAANLQETRKLMGLLS